ncbi:hypothetical protein EJ110_NYTH59744 [Nymphaea thermarum]|nr:hypothetical protein EJ110_NYTH59744 [Nymphaea thermarum]
MTRLVSHKILMPTMAIFGVVEFLKDFDMTGILWMEINVGVVITSLILLIPCLLRLGELLLRSKSKV